MDKIGEDPELLESVGFAELVEGMVGNGQEETMKETERWMRTERRGPEMEIWIHQTLHFVRYIVFQRHVDNDT